MDLKLPHKYTKGIARKGNEINVLEDSSALTYTFIYSTYEICKKRLDYISIAGFSVCELSWSDNDTMWCGKFVRSKLLCIYDYEDKFYNNFSKEFPKGYVKYWDSYMHANQQLLQSCSEYSIKYWEKYGYKGNYYEFIAVFPFDSCYILKLDIGLCINSGLFDIYEQIVLYNILTYFKMFQSQCTLRDKP